MLEVNSCIIGGTRVTFGENAVSCLPEAIHRLGGIKALLIVDPNVIQTPGYHRIADALSAAKTAYEVYDRVIPNAYTHCVNEAAQKAKQCNCDIIVAIGGGSTLDTGKSCSILACHEGSLTDYLPDNGKPFSAKKLPLITIPTTSGTGSEMSTYAVHTITETGEKFSFNSQQFTSNEVILDPDLPTYAPMPVVVSTATDALVHAIEAYMSKWAVNYPFPYIDALALKSISLIHTTLPLLCADPGNLEHRMSMMFAASISGAIIGYGVTAAHGMDSMLIHHYGTAHGEAVGGLIPAVMDYNRNECPERLRNIAEAMGVNTSGLTDQQASDAAINAVVQLLKDAGLPSLKALIPSSDDLCSHAEEVVDSYSCVENIRPMGLKEIREILFNAYEKYY